MPIEYIKYQVKDKAALYNWLSDVSLAAYEEDDVYPDTFYIRTTSETTDACEPEEVPEECGETASWKEDICCGKTWTEEDGKIMLEHWNSLPRAKGPE